VLVVVFVVMSSKYRIGNACSGNDSIDDKASVMGRIIHYH
jgi:hypothetical protein